MNDQYLTYMAYFYWLKEEPLPVDLYIDMTNAGISPECLLTQFAEGFIPCDCEDCNDEDCSMAFSDDDERN